MKSDFERPRRCSPAFLPFLLLISFAAVTTSGVSLERTSDALECRLDGNTLWRFSFATNQSKPFFHPLCLSGGEPLTTLQPADHRWHYGLWFSWKYINGVNYWEEDKITGRAQGATKWDAPKITTHKGGSANIKMTLRYVSTNNGLMMMEKREIHVSPPRSDGGVTIDWIAKFTAGSVPLLLDRTHMPGEENGAVNGGYAGLSLRAAQTPALCEFVTVEGPIEKFESDRARPNSKAAACNVTKNGRTDGVAILSHISNTGGDSPWYMVNSANMHWFSPVLLAPAPKKMKPRETFKWRFRIISEAGPWTSATLRSAVDQYR